MTISPITLFAGETRLLTVTVEDSDTGLAADISGAETIEFQANRWPGADDPPLISKTLGAGITRLTQSGASLGQFTIALEPEDTEDLPGRLYYDVVITTATTRYYVVEPSPMTIRPPVNPSTEPPP